VPNVGNYAKFPNLGEITASTTGINNEHFLMWYSAPQSPSTVEGEASQITQAQRARPTTASSIAPTLRACASLTAPRRSWAATTRLV
jgi:hypothetical protein